MALSTTIQQTVVTGISYTFDSLNIGHMSGIGPNAGKLYADIKFTGKGANGTAVPSVSVRIQPTAQGTANTKGYTPDYNTFWANFNTGTYLYDTLNVYLGNPVATVPSLEADFVNA